MKTLMIVICFLIMGLFAEGQANSNISTEVRKVFLVYESVSIPYLQTFARNLVPPKERNTKSGNNFEKANFLFYKTKLGVIEATCNEFIAKKTSADSSLKSNDVKRMASQYLADEFMSTYPGLTFEFFEKVKAELGK